MTDQERIQELEQELNKYKELMTVFADSVYDEDQTEHLNGTEELYIITGDMEQLDIHSFRPLRLSHLRQAYKLVYGK